MPVCVHGRRSMHGGLSLFSLCLCRVRDSLVLRVAAGENDDDEIKIPRRAEGAACDFTGGCERIDLFQHLTFNHDKTVGKLIVLQDIRHQSPLILSGAPRHMNTNCLSRQPSHP